MLPCFPRLSGLTNAMIWLRSPAGGRRAGDEGVVARAGLAAHRFSVAQTTLTPTLSRLQERGSGCVGLLVATLLVLSLNGCATQVSKTSAAQNAVTPTPVIAQPLQSFTTSGRFSAKRSDSTASGQFRYEQRGVMKTLELFTPASTPLARIDATAQSATVTMADGATRSAASLSELLQSFIEIRVTDAQFSAWLQGLPSAANAANAIERDTTSRLQRFTEAGWLIEVSARTETAPNFARRMRWVYTPETDTELRWVIDEFAGQ